MGFLGMLSIGRRRDNSSSILSVETSEVVDQSYDHSANARNEGIFQARVRTAYLPNTIRDGPAAPTPNIRNVGLLLYSGSERR